MSISCTSQSSHSIRHRSRCFLSCRRNMAARFTDAVVAQRYALFRPHYPESLLNGILNFVTRPTKSRTSTPNAGVAPRAVAANDLNLVDVGCGSGQSTFFLAKAGFKEIHGIDTSQAQIAEARKALEKQDSSACDRVEFKIVDVDRDIPFRDGSVDIITAAQALHWFNHDQFYKHVDKALKPGGFFMGFGYGNCQVLHNGVQGLLGEFYGGKLGKYWSPERRHIDTLYNNMPMPYKPVERLSLELQYDVTLAHLIGYISSWSAYATYCLEHPSNTVLEDLEKQMIEAIKSSAVGASKSGDKPTQSENNVKDHVLGIRFPIFALMCRKPDGQ